LVVNNFKIIGRMCEIGTRQMHKHRRNHKMSPNPDARMVLAWGKPLNSRQP
jgi:hypothetical protein